MNGAITGVALSPLAWAANPTCFVAGTQVVVAVEAQAGEDGQGGEELLAASGGTVVARKLRYVTKNIEEIREGDVVVSRDQDDPDAPLTLSRVDRTYIRRADHLQHVTIRSADGQEQTLHTTDEHPFYVVGKGWVHAEDLTEGDQVCHPQATGEVISSIREEHPEGVSVFNFRVENTHSYFVRAQGSTCEPVWVHNADYSKAYDRRVPVDEIGGKYQEFVTGRSYEEMWNTPSGSLKGVDAFPKDVLVEVKWAGRDARQFMSSRNNPMHELFDEARIIDQARGYLDMNEALGTRGVRYALSNDAAREAYLGLFRQHFPEAIENGTLQVWHVPANGMR